MAEARQVEIDLCEAEKAGSPYPDNADYPFAHYLAKAREEVQTAILASASQWPRGFVRQIGCMPYELMSIWTGSEHETAVAALHRAEGILLMVLPQGSLRAEALKVEANFLENNDIPLRDPRNAASKAMFDRLRNANPPPVGAQPAKEMATAPVASGAVELVTVQAPAAQPLPAAQSPPAAQPLPAAQPPPTASTNGSKQPPSPTDIADRVLLREIRRQQNESWEIARSRVRIFRNILSAAIPFLTLIVIGAGVLSWLRPDFVAFRKPPITGEASDLALIACLGAFGGLLSAVASLQRLRNFQRFYGLPLAQTILKLPAGAVTAVAGMLLLQHGVLGSVGPVDWATAMAYAVLLGVAQIAVTKRIDSRANDLLGDANSKSPATALVATTPADGT
jgi:hypothetical protein